MTGGSHVWRCTLWGYLAATVLFLASEANNWDKVAAISGVAGVALVLVGGCVQVVRHLRRGRALIEFPDQKVNITKRPDDSWDIAVRCEAFAEERVTVVGWVEQEGRRYFFDGVVSRKEPGSMYGFVITFHATPTFMPQIGKAVLHVKASLRGGGSRRYREPLEFYE